MRFSDAEWRVMNAVWDRDRATVREVLEAVAPDTDWAYSTVKTMLERLAEKGALDVAKDGTASVYTPRAQRSEARRDALRSLIDHSFDGAFGSFVHDLLGPGMLSPRDRRELRRILEADEDPTR